MGKKSTAPAVAAPGWEVEPPPAMAEGYTWCPECQAAFEGDVCPGCSIGVSPGISPETEVLVAGITPETRAAIVKEVEAQGLWTVDSIPLDDLTEWAALATLDTLELLRKVEPETGPAEPALKNLNDLQEAVKVAELDVKTRNTTESLKCILTDDEIRRYGIAQARANAEIATAEEELQSVKSQYKSRVDAATANRNDMAKRINNGYEFRQIECQERWDYTSNVIRVIRMDTYETVSRRTMTRDEMQRKLF